MINVDHAAFAEAIKKDPKLLESYLSDKNAATIINKVQALQKDSKTPEDFLKRLGGAIGSMPDGFDKVIYQILYSQYGETVNRNKITEDIWSKQSQSDADLLNRYLKIVEGQARDIPPESSK